MALEDLKLHRLYLVVVVIVERHLGCLDLSSAGGVRGGSFVRCGEGPVGSSN